MFDGSMAIEQRPKEAAHGTEAVWLQRNVWWTTDAMLVVHIDEEARNLPGYQLGPDATQYGIQSL